MKTEASLEIIKLYSRRLTSDLAEKEEGESSL
jgi:hypothetical protein